MDTLKSTAALDASGEPETGAVAAQSEVPGSVVHVSATESETATPGSALSPDEIDRLTADIIAALKTVYDPEIPSDIYELGLIYAIDIEEDRQIKIDMTLTSPGCPVAAEMPGWVENAVSAVPGVSGTKVNLVFDPPWHHGRMSDEARLALNMF